MEVLLVPFHSPQHPSQLVQHPPRLVQHPPLLVQHLPRLPGQHPSALYLRYLLHSSLRERRALDAL